ncbi:MAG: ABC transporter permease [Actinobacteria bacterium]|nr:ABC transporter permease [Actinomycetota bacterium]
MFKGFVRDRMALFFTILFPLVFLFLFGGIFAGGDETPRSDLEVIGQVSLVDDLPPDARQVFDDLFVVHRTTDREAALAKVRDGDADGVLEQEGDRIVLHFSQADTVGAATVQGTLSSFVDEANLASAGVEPRYTFEAEQVEDESLARIQYVAPGLIGWAVATSATFGAALTLVTWRQSELLRRLRLAPVAGSSIVVARVVVALVIALSQLAIFLVSSVLFLGLRLDASWWLSIPLVAAGTLTFMAIGLFCGAVARTNEGATGLANLVVLPMAFLSGSFFPLDLAPDWIVAVSYLLPLRYLNEGMLDVMVRGLGPGAVVVPILVMLGFALVVGGLSSRLIRWDKA